MTLSSTKGERLMDIINHLGITQTRFCEVVDWDIAYLNNIIKGRKNITESFLEKFSDKYGDRYNVAWLLTGKGEMLLEPGTHSDKVQEPAATYEVLIKRIDEIETDIKLLKSITTK